MPKLVLLAALLTVTSFPVLAQAAGATAEQAAEVVERLFRSTAGPGTETELTYGAVPAALPLRLDPRLNVLASLRTSANGGQYVQHRVLISTTLPADQARATLQQSLEATGWRVLTREEPRLGFAAPQTPSFSTFYREGDTNFVVNIGVVEREGRTDLDLNLNPVAPQQIQAFKRAPAATPRSSLPLLRALPGATIRGSYPAVSPNGAMSSAYLRTDRSANEVMAFYSAQLKAAGWKARTDTTDGPLRVVTYSLRDLNGREALGTLGIRPWEKEDGGYVLTISVQGFKPW